MNGFEIIDSLRASRDEAEARGELVVGWAITHGELETLVNDVFSPGGTVKVPEVSLMGLPILQLSWPEDETAVICGVVFANPKFPHMEAAYWHFRVTGKLPSRVYVGKDVPLNPNAAFEVVGTAKLPGTGRAVCRD